MIELPGSYARAALGAILIGAGIMLMLSAAKVFEAPCVDCGDAEEVAAEVAAASAELNGEEPEA